MRSSTSPTFCNSLFWQLNQVRHCFSELVDCHQNKKTANKISIDVPIHLTETFSVQLFTSIRNVSALWDEIAPPDKLFLQRSYLSALENHPPENMRFCYFLFYEEQEAAGIAIGQVLPFQAAESLNEQILVREASVLPAVEQFTKDFLTHRIQFSVLTIGNLLLTGEHGFAFRNSVNRLTQFTLLEKAATLAQQRLTQNGWRIDAVSFKDFFAAARPSVKGLTQANFKECCLQPNMVMPLEKEWETFEDYLSALTSKYRVRAKRAFKKAATLERHVLDANAIEQQLPQLHQLYQKVAQNADFNVLTLHPGYFLALAQELGDKYQLNAYFREDHLIGFCTTIRNGVEIEAHFLGFEETANQEHQLYLNILFDIIEQGIQQRAARIVFARTAPEIKSSIGAKAHDMYCYIRHRQPVFNQLMRPLLNYLQPKVEWEERHPFRS